MSDTQRAESEESATEEQHDWHPLPGMIGDAIVADDHSVTWCGGYVVDREDGEVLVYRVADVAGGKEELPDAEHTFHIGEAYLATKQIASLEAPEGGWDSEVKQVGESLWGGFE